MKTSRIVLSFVPLFALVACFALARPAAAAETLKGKAILDHPCGKVAVKHMGLVHAGKMEEAVKLGTADMQKQWQAMNADDRKMMTGMMKDMSQSEEDFKAEIEKSGELTVDGSQATLQVTKTTKDENGSSTETMTQRFELSGSTCAITH
jgi:hypothetical protein